MSLIVLSSCNDSTSQKNNTPVAIFTFAPENADTATIFTFDAGQSSDVEDPVSSLLFMWDFEGQHNWTKAVSNPIANYKYAKAGEYNVTLKVIDTEGWVGKTSNSIVVTDTL